MEARVSRETLDRLDIFHDLLVKWQKTINLVSPSTLGTIWARHIVDSAQLWDHAGRAPTRWLDLGTGAGFPGLVVAALADDCGHRMDMILVESDVRKCGFLREAARVMGLRIEILPRRIADIPAQHAEVISARALLPLASLVEAAEPHLSKDGLFLFPKGAAYKGEIESLPREWQSTTEILPSLTDPSAVILRIRQPQTNGSS